MQEGVLEAYLVGAGPRWAVLMVLKVDRLMVVYVWLSCSESSLGDVPFGCVVARPGCCYASCLRHVE